MLEKNKDYLEMRVSSTDCAFTQNEATQISIDGCVYTTYMDIPNPGELYVFISKEKFEKLQTENEKLKKKLEAFSPAPGYREFLRTLYSADDVEKLVQITEQAFGRDRWKFWKDNYEALDKLIGFSSVEEIQDYLTNEAECDTLYELISKLHDQVKYTCDEWKDIKKKLEECEKDYISERDKAEALEKENEQLRSERTHIVYLNDPLGVIAKWEKVTGYDRPEDFLKWKANIEGIMEAWKDVTGCKYPGDARRLLEKWKTLTKCETPEAAATWITSYESACRRGNRLAESVKNLKEEVDSWKNVTGYSTPEDYMHARISGAFHTPFDYTVAWQKATGCDTPDQVKSRIEGLENAIRLTKMNMLSELERKIDEWQTATGCVAPEKAQCKITDLYNRIDKMKEAASIASNWTDKIVEG